MNPLRAVLAALPALIIAIPNPEEYVNTLGGTQSRYDLSRGNILPEVVLPWGFNGWSPITDTNEGSWYFLSLSRRIYGIRCTHQPSPWIADWGHARIMASMVDPQHADKDQFSAYDPAKSQWSPYLWNATLLAFGGRSGYTTLELTPTNHGSLLRVRFPPFVKSPTSGSWNQTRRVLFSLEAGGNNLVVNTGGGSNMATMTGASTVNQGMVPSNFSHYYYLTVEGVNGAAVEPFSSGVSSGNNPWAFLDFDPTDAASDTLIVRVATSLISPAQARANHAAEVAGIAFDAAVAAAKATWRTELQRVSVDDVGPGYTTAETKDLLTTFYSSMYRASKYPRDLSEKDAATGAQVHYSPYANGQVLAGPLVTDQGFWDSYRTLPGLLALTHPAQLASATEGWLNAWREGGWVPQWSSPGYRGGMTGTMSDVAFAETFVKLPHCNTARAVAAGYCVNASALYAASRRNAFDTNAPGYAGRSCLADYISKGYITADGACDASVSRSLNY